MKFLFIEEGYGSLRKEADGLSAPIWDSTSQSFTRLTVSWETVAECRRVALVGHGNARFWLRRGDARRARRAYRNAANHCRVLGFLPWMVNVASRPGANYDFSVPSSLRTAEFFLTNPPPPGAAWR